MNKAEVSELVKQRKAALGLSWEAIAAKIGMSPVWTTSACLGMNSMPKDKADALVAALELPAEASGVLQACPHKSWDKTIPTDPLIYRFYEAINVYGETMKELIHEKFGDGIMSAIDFSMHIDRQADPKGDRVVVTWNGKFLPYKSW
jgi:cyanate lyase